MSNYGYSTVISLRRKGSWKYPLYDIIVVQEGKKHSSGFLDNVGFYNPMCHGNDSIVLLDLCKIGLWLYSGAVFYSCGRSYSFMMVLCFYFICFF